MVAGSSSQEQGGGSASSFGSSSTNILLVDKNKNSSGSKNKNMIATATPTHQKPASTIPKSPRRQQHWSSPLLQTTTTRTSISRMVFLCSMAAAAAICGYVTFRSIDNLEDKVAEETYESIAVSALNGAQAITVRKVQGSDAMAAVLSATFPNASQWPFVAMPEYINVASKVARLSSSTSTAIIPVVKPEDALRFEEYAAQVYRDHDYPETAGTSAFGFGIFGFDRESGMYPEDGRYHDKTGETKWNSTLDILTPIFQHNLVNAKSLMYNVHSEAVRGTAIESAIECAATASTTTGEPHPQCGVVTDVVTLVVRPGPSGLLYQPVYPSHDPNTVVGFIGTSIHWQEVLTNVVPDYVDGLDCVIQTSTQTYTYVIHNGVPELRGSGDRHDPKFDRLGHTIVLNDIATSAKASAVYTLTVYPTKLMFLQFHTNSPLAISLGFVAVILFCTGCFFLYDFFIQSESQQRQVILDMKRRFVRFISHEIRTPLNTVCMGLDLLKSELQAELDKFVAEAAAEEANNDTNKNDNAEGGGSTMLTKVEDKQDTPIDSSSTSKDGTAAQNDKSASSTTLSIPSTLSSSTTNKAYLTEMATNWMELTADVMENTETAVAVLNDLLNYDKIESGNFVLTFGQVNIWSVVEKVVAEFQIQARNRKVDLQYSTILGELDGILGDDMINKEDQATVLKVIGDDIRLCQVFRNLISNSLKFTTPVDGFVHVAVAYHPEGLVRPPPGAEKKKTSIWRNGRRATNSIKAGQPTLNAAVLEAKDDEVQPPERAGTVSIVVRDNGSGMTPEQLGQVFAEFTQFDSNKLQSGGGSGLGLNITKEIVEQHGGAIIAQSEGPDKGSTFRVDLPLYRYPTYTPQHHESKNKNEEGGDNTSMGSTHVPRHHHILVVDDVLTNSKMMVRLLERAGHTCVIANNGKEAVDAYTENQMALAKEDLEESMVLPFDTILMDSEMPVMEGPEATRQLRAMGCHAYIFGVTGNVLAEDVAHFRACGADDVLPKPVKLCMLEDCWSQAH